MRRETASLIILAGGASKRMGFPKHRLQVYGKDALSHLQDRLGGLFEETLVVGRDLQAVPAGVRVAEDRCVIRSPLVGMHEGLIQSRTDLCFVVACDMPYVEPALVDHILDSARGCDVAVPVVRGHYEPLCAAYRRACIHPIGDMIASQDLKVSHLYAGLRTRRVSQQEVLERDPALRSFINLNVPRQLESVARPAR